MNQEQINTLNANFTAWQVEDSGGELRYQATPRGSIIGFYGYAATQEEAFTRLMRNAVRV
jgi:hypothetical protein